jgi:deazaflavin-dependent oxidoreductase (nitroreductase family)
MPLPHWLTRVNLAFGNRIMRPIAAWAPWFAVLEHTGRTTGIVRTNPVMAFRHGDRLVIALTYGTEVQWLKNLVAAGECRARVMGRWSAYTAPRQFHDPSRRQVPWAVRPVLAALRVADFVELSRSPADFGR